MALITLLEIIHRDISWLAEGAGKISGNGLVAAFGAGKKLELLVPNDAEVAFVCILNNAGGAVESARKAADTIWRCFIERRCDLFAMPPPDCRNGRKSHLVADTSAQAAEDAVITLRNLLIAGFC